MEDRKVALRVTGIITGIIVVCVILALVIGVPLLRSLKYNNAIKNAQEGNYMVAIQELDGIDNYKDVRLKKQEYALEAAKQFYQKSNWDDALACLEIARNYPENAHKASEADDLYRKIQKIITQ